MTARLEKTVTSGTFTLDGQTFDVDNNVWVLGDDEQCVVHIGFRDVFDEQIVVVSPGVNPRHKQTHKFVSQLTIAA